MARIDIRGRLPSRNSISQRLPSEETRLKARIYGQLFLAVLALVAGATAVISGLVLIPMMAFAGSIAGVVAASASIAVGGGVAGASYIWLTGPAG